MCTSVLKVEARTVSTHNHCKDTAYVFHSSFIVSESHLERLGFTHVKKKKSRITKAKDYLHTTGSRLVQLSVPLATC